MPGLYAYVNTSIRPIFLIFDFFEYLVICRHMYSCESLYSKLEFAATILIPPYTYCVGVYEIFR